MKKEIKFNDIDNLKPFCIITDYDTSKTNGVEYSTYLVSVTNYARCTREIKSRIGMAKAAFNTEKLLFTYT
jgi:hypothetical protein